MAWMPRASSIAVRVALTTVPAAVVGVTSLASSKSTTGPATGAVLISLGVATAISGAMVFGLERRRARRLRALAERLEGCAAGDLRLSAGPREGVVDELTPLDRGIDALSESLHAPLRQLREVANRMSDHASGFTGLAGSIGHESSQIRSEAASVTEATEEMSANLSGVAGAVEQSSGNLNGVAGSIDQMSTNLGTISTGAAEVAGRMRSLASSVSGMTSALGDVERRSSRADERTVAASGAADEASRRVEDLDSAAQQIEDVVETINDIAAQTNLLALNATIEAASAGEAGRGFSVVANEGKVLAQQTSTATGGSRARVEDIQKATRSATEAIRSIVSPFAEIREDSSHTADSIREQLQEITQIAEISSAVADDAARIEHHAREASSGSTFVARSAEELSVATNEVARNTHEASAAATCTSASIHRVEAGVTTLAEGVRQMNLGSKELALEVIAVQQMLKGFRIDDRVDFDLEKAQHKVWVGRLRSFLDGLESIPEAEVKSCRDCQLGQWLYSVGLEQYGRFDEMHVLEREHEQIHALIRQVIDAYETDADEAERIFQLIPAQSDRILALLCALEGRINGESAGPGAGGASPGGEAPGASA